MPWEVVPGTTVPGFLQARIMNSTQGSSNGNDVMVLKIFSFGVDSLSYDMHVRYFDAVADNMVRAAEQRNINRLLVDVSTNGGGYVSLLWRTLQIVLGPDRWGSSAELCEGVNLRLSPTAKLWLQGAEVRTEIPRSPFSSSFTLW